MRIILTKKEGEFINNNILEEHLGMLEDGRYVISVIPYNNKTERDMQNQYFLLIDIISSHTGNTRQEEHESFKSHANVASTKNLSLQEWISFIDNLKWYAFNNLDLVL